MGKCCDQCVHWTRHAEDYPDMGICRWTCREDAVLPFWAHYKPYVTRGYWGDDCQTYTKKEVE